MKSKQRQQTNRSAVVIRPSNLDVFTRPPSLTHSSWPRFSSLSEFRSFRNISPATPNLSPQHPSSALTSTQKPTMAGNEKKNGKKLTPVRPNKPKLQRRPLTQTTGDGSSMRWTQSAVFDPTDEDAISMSLQTISDPLPAGFVLSEKTLNMNNYSLQPSKKGCGPRRQLRCNSKGGLRRLLNSCLRSSTRVSCLGRVCLARRHKVTQLVHQQRQQDRRKRSRLRRARWMVGGMVLSMDRESWR